MHGMQLVVYLSVVFVVLVSVWLLVFRSSIIFSLLRYLATPFLVLNQIVFAAWQAKIHYAILVLNNLVTALTLQGLFATSNGADLFCPIPLFFSVPFLLPCFHVVGQKNKCSFFFQSKD